MTVYDIISAKRDGIELSPKHIQFMIKGISQGTIPDYQISAWLMAIYLKGMTDDEKHHLTQAMLHSGDVINLQSIPGIKVDKHSTGGVGDKTSIILAPIVAAAGVSVPMISGRGLGHTGGTLDKLQSIPGFKIDYNEAEFKKIISETGLGLIGQTERIAPADKKIYALRDVTATVQSIPLISSSIMSKKLAEGIDALVLDVKTGKGAFMQTVESAEELAQSLIAIGEKAGKQTVAYITNMNEPLGNKVGNWLEIAECIDCLHGKGPEDLMEITLQLSGAMIWMGKKATTIEQGIQISKEMIESGKAWFKFVQIVKRQNGSLDFINEPAKYPKSKFIVELVSSKTGYVDKIDALEVGLSAVMLGAGRSSWEDKIDPKAGIVLHKKTTDHVKKGEKLITFHTDKKDVIDEVTRKLEKAIAISSAKPTVEKRILKYLDKNNLPHQ